MNYAVLKVKKIDGVRHLTLECIFDSQYVAESYSNLMNEHSSVRVCYIVKPVESSHFEIECNLITRCRNIAECLNLADICMMKNGNKSFEKASYWFNLAKSRSKIAADLLETL